jgi:probable HAF family extracellular repeat protein
MGAGVWSRCRAALIYRRINLAICTMIQSGIRTGMIMALRKLFRKLLLLPLLAGPLVALADPITYLSMSETNPGDKDFVPHAFLYENVSMADLGFLGGTRARALGINNGGMIVGDSEWSVDSNDSHALLYANHAMVDLNSLIDPANGWQIVSAKDINDAQQILATACRMGECTTVRLDLISAVPEPKVWGMLLAGLALMASRRHRAFRSETFS